jgi:prepilin-type N-terminal cleavage/methylation domain-containing protein
MKKFDSSERRSRAAFTLIEMMIVVAIVGVLSSLAVPAFRSVLLRSRTAEVSSNLNAMFKNAASYYSAERGERGQTASVNLHCTVSEVGPIPSDPGVQKQRVPNTDPNFRAIGFSIADYVYYGYGLTPETGLGACGGTANNLTVYTLFAIGDLDGDNVTSMFELAVGSDNENELYHSRGMSIDKELE